MRLFARRHGASVRWTILAFLTCFSFVSYLNRMNITIAAQFIGNEFGFNSVQLGRVFSSFLLGYALFQIPAGILGDRFGPRIVLTWAAVSWGVFTFLTSFLPGLVHTPAASLGLLIVVRFCLGVGEAPTYPVAARGLANWFPRTERGFANSVVIGGLALGSACTPPIVSWLMLHIGWRNALYVSAAVACLIAPAWAWYGYDRPEQHPRISEEEIKVISEGRIETEEYPFRINTCWKLLSNREIVLLALSYCCLGYVFYIFIFWFYIYLLEVRGFGILKGSFFTSIPFVVSAVLTPLGGWLTDLLSRRIGLSWGRRSVGLIGMTLASILLFVGAFSSYAYLALGSLCLCVGFLEFTEGSFWSSTIDVAGPYSGTAAGILNMGSNFGGVVSTAIMPVLVNRIGWLGALSSGAVISLVGSFLWLGIRADRPFASSRSPS
jgi:MFS transporter, ACS family, glucarate transporter